MEFFDGITKLKDSIPDVVKENPWKFVICTAVLVAGWKFFYKKAKEDAFVAEEFANSSKEKSKNALQIRLQEIYKNLSEEEKDKVNEIAKKEGQKSAINYLAQKKPEILGLLISQKK